MPAPPTPGRDLGLVHAIIRENPGRTLPELTLSSGLWAHELSAITKQLHESRAIETRDGRLFVRDRKKSQSRSRPSGPGS